MSLPCSVYPLHSSFFFKRFSPLSFQHDISPQYCLTQSGLLDNKCASYTAPSLHQLVSAIHLTNPPLAGLPRPLTPHYAMERHKAGCVCCLSVSHYNQPPPPHVTCRTPMCDCPWEGGPPTWQKKKKKSIRGWWKFAIFPFVSFWIIRHILVTVMLTNQMFLAFFGGAEAFLHLQQQTNQLNSKYGFRPFKLWVSICRHLRASVAKTNPYCPVHTYLHLLSLSVWDLIAFWNMSLWKSTILMTVNKICTKRNTLVYLQTTRPGYRDLLASVLTFNTLQFSTYWLIDGNKTGTCA